MASAAERIKAVLGAAAGLKSTTAHADAATRADVAALEEAVHNLIADIDTFKQRLVDDYSTQMFQRSTTPLDPNPFLR